MGDNHLLALKNDGTVARDGYNPSNRGLDIDE